jgi:predicted dehydrogenase
LLGKPVLCEKAFTVTAEETEELIAIAKEKNLYLAEAMWTWFSPAANKVKEWVDSGAIGKVSGADFTYHMMSVNYAPRNSDPRRAGGALLNITVYPIAYAYRLFGYPTAIESTGKIVGGIDHGEEIKMSFAGGEVVNISASMVDTEGFERMTIHGENGKIKAPLYHASGIASLHRGLFKSRLFLSGGKIFNSYMDEFDKVADEIRAGLTESEVYPLQSTLDIMKIMDEIRGQIGLVYDNLE